MDQLQESLEQAKEYHESVLGVKGYLETNTIDDERKILYFLLMGLVWTASKRGEKLTDEYANIYLGLEPGSVTGIDGIPELAEMAQIPLVEFLDYLRTTYFN